MTSALIASWVAIFLLALVVSGLIRQVHQLSQGPVTRSPGRVGIPAGTAAPHADDLLGDERGAVLLFLSAECRTCSDVLAEATRWARDRAPGGPALRAVYAGPVPEGEHPAVPVLGDRPDLFTAYDAIATPFAVVVAETGRVVRSEPLGSRGALLELLEDVHPSQARSA